MVRGRQKRLWARISGWWVLYAPFWDPLLDGYDQKAARILKQIERLKI